MYKGTRAAVGALQVCRKGLAAGMHSPMAGFNALICASRTTALQTHLGTFRRHVELPQAATYGVLPGADLPQ